MISKGLYLKIDDLADFLEVIGVGKCPQKQLKS